jgi:beta-lactamase regulating signal transducer with metallopeptidase domain
MTALHELARVSAERMLNGVAEGMAIALFAGLLLHTMGRRNVGRRNSGTRFAVLLAALFSIAALPVLSIVAGSAVSSAGGRALWAVSMPNDWATYLSLAWAAIASVGLLRVALGLWQLRKVRAGNEAVDLAKLDPILQRTIGEFQSMRPVTLAVSEQVTVPAAIGFFQPMIVLPKWTLGELSTSELNSILIHELAHLERRDDWTNLAQKVLRALFFFHPAVWWVERQLSLEREMACDDVVLARTANPRAYAACLVTVAERSLMRRSLALAQAAVSKMRQTTLRISQILDVDRSAATRVWKPALALVTVASGIFVVGLARAPQLVAFRDSVPAILPVAALVSPASLPGNPAVATTPKAVLTSFHPKRTAPSRNTTAKPLQAKLTPPPSPAKAALPVSKPDDVPAQTMLVVMRTEQFGPSGASWTVRVWRVTMLKADHIPIELTIPAKSL